MIHAKIVLDSSQESRRREPRIDVATEVALRKLGHQSVDARLINISSRGFMAATLAIIEPQSRIWVTLPGAGRVNALVVWARSGRIGGEFAQPIDPLSVFQALGTSLAD